MAVQVLSIFAVVLLFSFASCNNNAKSETTKVSWQFPGSRQTPDTKIGRQMPPHSEPDAVLINTGANGQPGMPDGSFPELPGGPGNPGVFGFPTPGGGGPGMNGPRFFGGPGVFGFPNYPNTFGVPGGPVFPGNAGVSVVYGASGMPAGVLPMIPQGQSGPLMPNGPNVYTIRVGQRGPGFTVGTGFFGVNGGPPQPVEPRTFEQPSVFAVAGGGNIPFRTGPEYFFPAGGSNAPEATDSFPAARGTVPETFLPRGMNGFRPGGMLPGAFYPEAPLIPNQPEFNPGWNFPATEFYGGPKGRETYDDPLAGAFPLIETSPLFFKVPS